MISPASCRSSRVLQVVLILATVAIIAAVGPDGPSAQSTPLYGLAPIGQLGGAQQAPYDLTEFGQVIAGRAQTASGAYHAFAQDSEGIHDIGTLGGRDSTAFGASVTLTVGQAQNAAGQYHAFALIGSQRR